MRSFIVLLLCTSCGTSSVFVPTPDAEVEVPAASLRDTFSTAPLSTVVKQRVSAAGIRVRRAGELSIVLGVARNELGVVSRRLVASRGGVEAWSLEEGTDERFTDFALHPSGELTLGVERRSAASDAFDLLRFNAQGQVLQRQVLARPSIPAGDLAPAFLMKGVRSGSVVSGWLPWLRLEAHGEDVIVGLLSYADVDGTQKDSALASAVISLRWENATFTQKWARLVDGLHSMIAVAWQYDDFLWLDAATRMLVDVAEDGSVVVGRTLGNGRCNTLRDIFHERTDAQCRLLRSHGSAHRYQPFAFTRFTVDGVRVGTSTLAPDDLEEFVIFDMAVRGDRVAVAGTATRIGADGSPAAYVDESGTAMSPYDGYLAVVRQDSSVESERFADLGRADLFSALTWTNEGLLAVGASDWNRWTGGMSLSRGAQPMLALDPLDGSPLITRTLPTQDKSRHTHLYDVDVQGSDVLAVGPADAPMTHSGDASLAPMANGSIELRIR